MKVTINEIPVTLACSEAGKQALNTAEMTLRQRQFILLIKENTSLGEQAVNNLLSKLDLQQLIEKGWISCDVPLGQIFKQPSTPVAALASAIATTDAPSAETETVLSEKFTEVSDYISQHYQEDLSVAELAEKFHMSYSYFAAIFKEYYGQTCKEMILTVRLQKAEDLLLFTDFDLTYISQETGFCDCSHFIKAFKQKYGVTPRKYRMKEKSFDFVSRK